MVLKRNLELGYIAYDAPTIPRARRSPRKRILCKKTFNEGELCAFELLAAVAGKLLQESESSSASSSAAAGVDTHNNSKEFIKKEPQYNMDETTRTQQEGQGSSEESVVSSAIFLQKSTKKESNKEAVDASPNQISSFAKSASSGKEGSELKPLIHRNGDEIDGGSLNVDNGSDKDQELKCGTDILIGAAGKCSSKVSVESYRKISPPIQSSKKAGLGQCKGSVPESTHFKHTNHVKMEGTDDDEILSKGWNPKSQKAYGSPKSADNCQTRNLLTFKYWKSGPKLKDCQPANSDSQRNNINLSGKSCCEQERSQHNTPFKKRKLFGQTSVVTHDGGISSESVSNITAKRVSNWSGSVTNYPAGNKISPSSVDCQQSLNSSHAVKLSVKSFKVPELLIDVPNNASVGSLKKTVLDAITTVLGSGLRVGVLLHGKKIRDDGKTLLQTGISEDDNLNDLNFILEPSSPTQLSLNSFNKDCPILPSSPLPKDVNRSLNPKQEFSPVDRPMKTSITSSGRNCQDLVPFSAPGGENKPVSDSRALVRVPEDVPALAAVPINSRPRRTELGQRRTRRPFSVSEVEALVQAVEKLGTGRWRDVKLCSFENAKHRTYVDLKDKWKTLVHTARISPQQRRGEPVPQQLLDRVLAAHAYWAHHQAKQHGKHLLQLSHS